MSITAEAFTGDAAGQKVAPLVRPSSLLAEWQRIAQAANESFHTGKPRGPVTGFALIDRTLGGALEPGLHIVHGGAGVGKTAWCLQVAQQCGYPCLLVTAEMSPMELLRRTTARETGTFLGRLKSGELDVASSVALAQRGLAAIPEVAFLDATRMPAPAHWIAEAAREVNGQRASMLLIVDSVHSWTAGICGEATEYEALNAAVQSLQQIASQLRIPVLAVAERNRGSMQSGGVSAGAGTRRLEYGAETVIGLDRQVNAERFGNPEESVIRVRLEKNRHGAVGAPVHLVFFGALQKFREAG